MKISVIDESETWELTDIFVHAGRIEYTLGPKEIYDPESEADYIASVEEDRYQQDERNWND